MPLTTLLLLFTIRPPTILQPFHTSPSLPLPFMGCLTMVCPTVDCSPTMGFQPTPTQACPALPTTPLPLPLQRGRRSRQLWSFSQMCCHRLSEFSKYRYKR